LQEKAQQLVTQLGEQAQQAAGDSAALAIIEPKQKEAAAALAAATAQLKQATDTAAPRDVVDIIATEPVQLKVTPAN
ncbi:MAG: hypothetical protein ACKO3P_08015, partial [Planctomycetaceae bacterium]